MAWRRALAKRAPYRAGSSHERSVDGMLIPVRQFLSFSLRLTLGTLSVVCTVTVLMVLEMTSPGDNLRGRFNGNDIIRSEGIHFKGGRI